MSHNSRRISPLTELKGASLVELFTKSKGYASLAPEVPSGEFPPNYPREYPVIDDA